MNTKNSNPAPILKSHTNKRNKTRRNLTKLINASFNSDDEMSEKLTKFKNKLVADRLNVTNDKIHRERDQII